MEEDEFGEGISGGCPEDGWNEFAGNGGLIDDLGEGEGMGDPDDSTRARAVESEDSSESEEVTGREYGKKRRKQSDTRLEPDMLN